MVIGFIRWTSASILARQLNMSNVDLPNQLHHALFHGSGGFVLKPPEMLVTDLQTGKNEQDDVQFHGAHDGDVYWPPPRQAVHQATIQILSLHNFPKVDTNSL